MAKRYRKRRKYKSYKSYWRSDPAPILLGILALGLAYWVYVHRIQIIVYLSIAAIVLGLTCLVYFFFKKRQEDAEFNFLRDDEILSAFKKLAPAQFEKEVADIFERLGYATTVVGGPNDRGVDVRAKKDGKRYFIQCKRFQNKTVGSPDVREFLGAIKSTNHPAEKGFFVTTSGFTLEAVREAEGDPRIELISGIQLVRYYRMAHKDAELREGILFLEESKKE